MRENPGWKWAGTSDQSCILVAVGQRSLQILLGEGEILSCRARVEREENHGMKL